MRGRQVLQRNLVRAVSLVVALAALLALVVSRSSDVKAVFNNQADLWRSLYELRKGAPVPDNYIQQYGFEGSRWVADPYEIQNVSGRRALEFASGVYAPGINPRGQDTLDEWRQRGLISSDEEKHYQLSAPARLFVPTTITRPSDALVGDPSAQNSIPRLTSFEQLFRTIGSPGSNTLLRNVVFGQQLLARAANTGSAISNTAPAGAPLPEVAGEREIGSHTRGQTIGGYPKEQGNPLEDHVRGAGGILYPAATKAAQNESFVNLQKDLVFNDVDSATDVPASNPDTPMAGRITGPRANRDVRSTAYGPDLTGAQFGTAGVLAGTGEAPPAIASNIVSNDLLRLFYAQIANSINQQNNVLGQAANRFPGARLGTLGQLFGNNFLRNFLLPDRFGGAAAPGPSPNTSRAPAATDNPCSSQTPVLAEQTVIDTADLVGLTAEVPWTIDYLPAERVYGLSGTDVLFGGSRTIGEGDFEDRQACIWVVSAGQPNSRPLAVVLVEDVANPTGLKIHLRL